MSDDEMIEEYLQIEYKDYVKRYKENYYDTNYSNYEKWLEEHDDEYGDLIVCANDSCMERVVQRKDANLIEDFGYVCHQCLEDGWGQ